MRLCETGWGPAVVTPEQVSLPGTGIVADFTERGEKKAGETFQT